MSDAEHELAELAQAIRSADRSMEAALLDRLTTLAGQVTQPIFDTLSGGLGVVNDKLAEAEKAVLDAKMAGAQVFATSSSDAKLDRARAMGAGLPASSASGCARR